MINDVPWRRLALVPVAAVLAAGSLSACRSGNTPAAVAASASASAAPPVELVAPSLPRPSAGAPTSEFQAWVGQEVRAAMKVQTEGLLSGDFGKFAGAAEPGNKALRAELQRRFRTLRALHVTRFDQRIDRQPLVRAKKGTWQVVHIAQQCFVEADCAIDEAVFDSIWAETPAGLRLTGFQPHARKSSCLRCVSYASRPYSQPWETTELIAQVGARTLVAVPPKYRSRLADLSRRAEKAAAVADRYRIGDTPVDRYRIYVADDASWRRWFGGYPGSWVAGVAFPTGPNRIDVEVRESDLTAGFSDELLTHELAHVSTLRNDTYYGQDDVWFLVEGMAEYVEHLRSGTGGYRNRSALNRLLRQRTLRSVSVEPPADNASILDAQGRYAVGYYTVTYLSQRYGKAKMLQFFQQAVQYGIGLDGASRTAFGKPWASVDKECAAYIRKL
ncbi:peptidase MA family metallohydrolase [Actinoplanes regularis]|uniref:Peptidase MA superfamily protein n=1 Tax=Actinoplanes regularis TaxID=52697 RepID=A0A239D4U8_9ACTN|nr:peptidase MA family metallohydrolase [Actinoplanes regularis]GIE88436.1 hypothetical protein Are01nite_49160 [Actinoplanes regularis]SNS26633.1 Peptidase MA superfamily protein [Actinoplanes regularis]